MELEVGGLTGAGFGEKSPERLAQRNDHINAWLFDEPLVLLGEDGAPFFDIGKDVAFAVEGRIWVNNHAHILRCGP